MKKIQRILSLLVSAGILAGSAGCASSKTGSAGAASAASAGAAVSSAAASSAQAASPWDKYKPADLKGRTITIAYNWQNTPATTSEKLDPKTVTKGQLEALDNMKRIEKKYNCKIKYISIPYDQLYKKFTASVIAGSPCADLIKLYPAMIINGAKANLIQDLESVFPKNADIINDQQILYPVKYLGKTYVMRTYDKGTIGGGIGFNRDLIKKLGVEAPDALYEKGEWNWDNFLKIAKAATQDTDGDGKMDQWGVGGMPYNIANSLICSNGGYLFDGTTPETGLSSPKTVEAFNFLNKLYNVEKVAYLKNPKGGWWDDGTGDTFKNGNIAMFYTELYMIPTDPKLKFQVGFVPTPKGPSDTEGKTWMTSLGGVIIPKGVSDPTAVYQIYEELSSSWGSDYKKRDKGAKESREKAFPTEEDVSRYLDMYDTIKSDYASAIEDSTANAVVDAIIQKGEPVAQAIQQNKQQSQAKIDAFLKK